jgi:hypothetical protein
MSRRKFITINSRRVDVMVFPAGKCTTVFVDGCVVSQEILDLIHPSVNVAYFSQISFHLKLKTTEKVPDL